MKFLICGLGSIGQRHLKNLIAIGEKDIIVYRSSRRELNLHFGKIDVPMFYDLDRAFKEKPDVVFVTNPTSLHISVAIKAAHRGCHLFIEKPISSDLNGINELLSEVTKKGLIGMVGCNMRFNPGLIKIKELLNNKFLGEVYFMKVNYSSYLPDWHPWEDYKKSYSARSDLGGGIILTIIHELDYPVWFFGEVKKVKCLINSKSYLKTDVDEAAEIIWEFKNNVMCSIHIDYLSRAKTRNLEIVGEKGKITWDYYDRGVKFYSNLKGKWQYVSRNDNWSKDVDKMYISELKHFIACIKNKKETIISLQEGMEVLKIALKAKEDAKN